MILSFCRGGGLFSHQQDVAKLVSRKWLIVVGVVLAVFFALIGVFQFVAKPMLIKQYIASHKPPPVTVSAVVAKSQSWEPFVTAIGTFDAVNGVAIAPQIAGRVKDILFESGQVVKQGTLLVRLDTSVEEADLKEARANLKLAELDYARSKELASRGNLAQANLDKARATRDAAEARVERIQAQITQKRIAAPFTGRLGIRKISLGEYVSAGAQIVTLQALDPIFVNFSLPEQELPRLKTGQTVKVSVGGFPGEIFTGKITSLDAQVNKATRNILVQATVPNADAKLLPGMFADVEVVLSGARQLVSVPQTAISYSLYGDSVYVVVAKGKGKDDKPALAAERRFVKVGDRRGDEIAILDGIKSGERVVTSGQIKLRPGAAVVIDNSVALKPETPRPLP